MVALENQLNSSINHWLRFLGPLHCPGEKAEVSLENESGQRGVVDRLPFLAVAMRAMMKLEIPELG